MSCNGSGFMSTPSPTPERSTATVLRSLGNQALVRKLLELDGTQAATLALDVDHLQLCPRCQDVLLFAGECRVTADADRLGRGHLEQHAPPARSQKTLGHRQLRRA